VFKRLSSLLGVAPVPVWLLALKLEVVPLGVAAESVALELRR
jgi:hypothetical protein